MLKRAVMKLSFACYETVPGTCEITAHISRELYLSRIARADGLTTVATFPYDFDNMSLEDSALDLTGDGPQTQDFKDINNFPSKSKRERNSGECSHKVIEKRRRDRINSCLAELGNLLPIPANSTKQGSGKLEKAEILEMTVEHLKKLQAAQDVKAEEETPKESELQGENVEKTTPSTSEIMNTEALPKGENSEKQYRGGYRDCTRDVLNFLVNVESMDLQRPSFQRLRAHMQHQLQLLVPGIGSMQHFQEARHRKRKHMTTAQSCGSSSSSSSSSNDERSSSSNSKRTKMDKDKHSSRSQVYKSSSNSSGSDKESSDSAVCMDDMSSEGSGGRSSEKNPTPPTTEPAMAYSRNKPAPHSSPGLLDGLLGTVPQAVPIPLRNPFMPTPFSTPTYALHPAGTHYIPVALHTGVPFPPYAPTVSNMPCGILPNAGPSVMGLPSMPPGVMGMPFQPSPYGVPLIGQNNTGFPSYPGVIPEFGLSRAPPHVVKMENSSGEDAASGSESNSDSRISGNGNSAVNSNNSPSPNSLSDGAM